MRTSTLVLFAAGALGAVAAHAQWGGWDADFDDDKKPWKEIEAKIPSYPKEGNLTPFDAGGTSPHRYFIDAQSLSIGEDGVVRYSLVVKTGGGATNVTFEGIRCDTREQKYYALGQANGTWARARNPQWRRIEYREVNKHHYVLLKGILCTSAVSGATPVTSVKEAVRHLKDGPPSLTTP